MSEPKTVYMVTDGEYSDYRIRAVFELEADAERAQQAGLGDNVAAIMLYPADAEAPTKQTIWLASCYLSSSNPYRVTAFSQEVWSCDPDWLQSDRPVVQEWRSPTGGSVQATAHTEEAALKAAADRAAKIRAEALEPGATS